MSMIDYGAVVFKNGKRTNFEFFEDMLKSVGWEDDSINGNYFAYIGDDAFTLAFYKTGVHVLVNKEFADHVWECGYRHWGDPDRVSYRESYGDVTFHIKHVCRNVYHLSMAYKGDYYHVVYGCGIDPDKSVWDKVKADYLGKSGAKKVDGLYKKLSNGGW